MQWTDGIAMDKLQLTGQNLDQVSNFRSDRVHAVHLLFNGVKLPNFKLKTRPKQLLGYIPLPIALLGIAYFSRAVSSARNMIIKYNTFLFYPSTLALICVEKAFSIPLQWTP